MDSRNASRERAVSIASALCRRFEGFYSSPYACPAGLATVGYGATFYADGRPVTLKDKPITREQGERLLQLQIERVFLPGVIHLCPSLVHETPERFGAIIDFAFNCGLGNLRASTLRRKINERAWDDVPAQLMRWNKAGGRVLRGLTIRRQAEADLI